jgi:hypothetical protein
MSCAFLLVSLNLSRFVVRQIWGRCSVYYLSGAGLIVCKDVGVIEAFSCLWSPSSTFYKLLEIERPQLTRPWYTQVACGQKCPVVSTWR